MGKLLVETKRQSRNDNEIWVVHVGRRKKPIKYETDRRHTGQKLPGISIALILHESYN